MKMKYNIEYIEDRSFPPNDYFYVCCFQIENNIYFGKVTSLIGKPYFSTPDNDVFIRIFDQLETVQFDKNEYYKTFSPLIDNRSDFFEYKLSKSEMDIFIKVLREEMGFKCLNFKEVTNSSI